MSNIIGLYKQNPNNLLLRGLGLQYDNKLIFKSQSRFSRTPRGSREEFAQLYNMFLHEKGITANRTNSIATTSDFNQASSFGSTFVIFPINGFEWSTQNVKDVGSQYSPQDDIFEVDETKLEEYADPVGFSWNEDIDFHHNLYRLNMYRIGKQLDPIDLYDILSVNETLNKIHDLFNPNNDSLRDALDSRNEILIHGEYFAVRYYPLLKTIKILIAG